MIREEFLILHIPDCANEDTQMYDIHLQSVEHANNVPLTYIYLNDRDFRYCKPPKSGVLFEVWRCRFKHTCSHLPHTHTLSPSCLFDRLHMAFKSSFWGDLVTWYLQLPDVLWDTQVGYTQLLC